jgi:hypothetical protein
MCCGRLLADTHIDGVAPEDPSAHLDLAATPTAARLGRRFLDHYSPGSRCRGRRHEYDVAYEVRVVDVGAEPQAAEEGNVIGVPTVVREGRT